MKRSWAFMVKRGILAITLALGILTVFSGCGFLGVISSAVNSRGGSDESGQSSEEMQELTAYDGSFTMKSPKDWKLFDKSYNEISVLSARNGRDDQHILVIPESKQDFSDTITLEEYNQLALDYYTSVGEDITAQDTESIQVGGRQAFVTEVARTVKKIKTVYWIYTIDYDDQFVQVVAWTLASKRDAAPPVFSEILATFQKSAAQGR